MRKLILSLLSAGAFTIHAQVIPPAASQSLQLTGTNYIEVPDNNFFDADTSLTYEGWFNFCEPGTILSKHYCSGAAGYYLIMRPNGHIDFSMLDGTTCSSSSAAGVSTNAFTFDEWHHFALTFNVVGGSTTMTLFMDHNATAEATATAAWTINNNTEPLRIGVYRNLNGQFSTRPTGRIYDFRAYRQVLAFANQCLHTPASTPFMRLNLTSSTGSVITNTGSGSTPFNGTHYNNTNASPTPGTAVATTPTSIATNLSLSNFTLVGSSAPYCTNTVMSVTASNTASTYSWTVLTPGAGSPTPLAGTTNTISYTPTLPGTYLFEVTATVGSCDSTYSIEIEAENCCTINNLSNFTTIPDGQIVSTDEYWGGTADDKYYIEGQLIVDNAILDLTSLDLIFGVGAEIIVRNGGKLISNNTVFRPCSMDFSWKGISFIALGQDRTSGGSFSECVFQNAENAIQITGNEQANDINITNCLFTNCLTGIAIDRTLANRTFSGSISGNTFEMNNYDVSYSTLNPLFAGIIISGTSLETPITQNDFSNMDYSGKDLVGVQINNNSNVSLLSNNFNNCQTAIADLASVLIADGNHFTISQNSAVGSQILINNSEGPVQISNNEFRATLPYAQNTNLTGIYSENSANLDIYSNYLIGFYDGMNLRTNAGVYIYDNEIENALNTGISTSSSEDLHINCNIIDLDYTANTTGIYYINAQKTNTDELISNCIFDCSNAVFVDGTDQLPSIYNNYFYNYSNFGIYINGPVGDIGTLSPNVPGKNSFFSNNFPNGSTDIFSLNPGVNAYGNFNLTAVSSNVTWSSNNDYNSTASCANQEDVNDNQTLDLNKKCQNANEFNKLFSSAQNVFQLDGNKFLNSNEDWNFQSEFIPILFLAQKNPVNSQELQDRLYAKTNELSKPLYDFYLSLIENNGQISDKYNQLANDPNISVSQLKYLQILSQIQLTGKMENSTYSELLTTIENYDEPFRNLFISELSSNKNRVIRPFVFQEVQVPAATKNSQRITLIAADMCNIYPNPTSDLITIEFKLEDLKGNSEMRITDVSGKVLHVQTLYSTTASLSLDVSNYTNGLYFVHFVSDSKEIVESIKFVKN